MYYEAPQAGKLDLQFFGAIWFPMWYNDSMSRPKDTRTREEKFHQSYSITENGCWQSHKTDKKGYGKFYYDYRHYRAHRVAWEIYNGPIPQGLLVRHKCDNPPCANPEHLELGTDADNSRDAVERSRTLTGERNTFAKLNATTVLKIRAEKAAGDRAVVLAERYNVTRRTINDIVSRRTWDHI